MDIRKKKQKKVDHKSPDRSEVGSAYGYTSVKRGTYFFPAFYIGNWTQETCSSMISVLSSRVETPTENNKLEIYTDGNDDYRYTLPKYFSPDHMDYGQLVKIRKNGTLIGKEKRIIFGNPDPNKIETTDVENFNGILRERIGRLVRKTKCFSKKKSKLNDAMNLFQFYWNFMKHLHKKLTPAMEEGIISKRMTWGSFLHMKLSYTN